MLQGAGQAIVRKRAANLSQIISCHQLNPGWQESPATASQNRSVVEPDSKHANHRDRQFDSKCHMHVFYLLRDCYAVSI